MNRGTNSHNSSQCINSRKCFKSRKIVSRMKDMYPDEADYEKWLNNPNQFLDGKTAKECLDGDVDLLYNFLKMCIVEW